MIKPTWQRDALKAPFPWFGGKRRVADRVWKALGDVVNYVEPFFGSGAVLLGRPANHNGTCETVNDADIYIANFWRALEREPNEVACYADQPVNECNLIAIHTWLVNTGRERIEKMESDKDYFDAEVAGLWVWGIDAWIGSGWCSGKGPWKLVDGKLLDVRQLPHLGNAGRGVSRQLPHLSDAGVGVSRKRPNLGDVVRGEIYDYFIALAARLRKVRVCCGDWSRVVSNGALHYGNTVGIFLDPPYLGSVRAADLYSVDDHTISIAVRDWAIANGDNPRYRIVLAGYWQEHCEAMPDTWTAYRYSANKSYGTTAAIGQKKGNDANRHNECLWYSPHCLTAELRQADMRFGLG